MLDFVVWESVGCTPLPGGDGIEEPEGNISIHCFDCGAFTGPTCRKCGTVHMRMSTNTWTECLKIIGDCIRGEKFGFPLLLNRESGTYVIKKSDWKVCTDFIAAMNVSKN